MRGLQEHRRQGAAREREASLCRAEGSRALVVKNTSDAVQPADGAQYPESNATSCLARLLECQARISARMSATNPGEPLSSLVHSRLRAILLHGTVPSDPEIVCAR